MSRQSTLETISMRAGGVAQELDNIRSAIQGYAELMLTNSSLADKDRRNLQAIHGAAERAGDLAGQILSFSCNNSNRSPEVAMKYHIPSLHAPDTAMFYAHVAQSAEKRIGNKNHYFKTFFATILTVALIVSIPAVYRKTEILVSADNYFFNHPALKELAIAYSNADWRLF